MQLPKRFFACSPSSITLNWQELSLVLVQQDGVAAAGAVLSLPQSHSTVLSSQRCVQHRGCLVVAKLSPAQIPVAPGSREMGLVVESMNADLFDPFLVF